MRYSGSRMGTEDHKGECTCPLGYTGYLRTEEVRELRPIEDGAGLSKWASVLCCNVGSCRQAVWGHACLHRLLTLWA